MSHLCPRGHQSTDADYCSECGARIGAAAALQTPPSAPSAPATISAASTDICPDCATARPPGARFCEVCRYDFQARASFTTLANSTTVLPAAKLATAPATSTAPAPVPAAPVDAAPVASTSATRLQLRIVADPALDKEPDPASPCPVGQPDRIFHLDLEENVLGRQFEGKGTHPEVVVNDPGISRRHMKFLRDDAGRFTVLELGSANGTELNGRELEAGIVTPIQPGDTFILGMWTRITVESR